MLYHEKQQLSQIVFSAMRAEVYVVFITTDMIEGVPVHTVHDSHGFVLLITTDATDAFEEARDSSDGELVCFTNPTFTQAFKAHMGWSSNEATWVWEFPSEWHTPRAWA